MTRLHTNNRVGGGKVEKRLFPPSFTHFPLMSRLLLDSCGAADRRARDGRPSTERSPILSFSVRRSLFLLLRSFATENLPSLTFGFLLVEPPLHHWVFYSASLALEKSFTLLAPLTLLSRIPRHELLRSINAPVRHLFFVFFFKTIRPDLLQAL